MPIAVAYSTDASIEQILRKGSFDQIKLEVESYTSFEPVLLITQDTRDFSKFFDGVRHVPCGIWTSGPLRWLLYFVKGFLALSLLGRNIRVVRGYGVGCPHAAVFSRIFRVPLVVSYEYDWSEEMLMVGRRTSGAFAKIVEGIVLRISTVTVVPSETLERKAKRKGAKSTVIISNGVDLSSVPLMSNHEKRRLSESFGIRGRNIVMYAGRLHRIKRLGDLVEAVHILKNRGGNAVLLIVGDGVERDRLERVVAEKGLKNDVIFTGFVSRDQALKLMQIADVFVLPSLMEGNPRILMEAMVCRTPIVGTNVCGIRDMIENGRNGLLVEACSPTALAKALESIIVRKDLAETLAGNAYKDAVKFYDWKVARDGNLNLIRSVASKAPLGSAGMR